MNIQSQLESILFVSSRPLSVAYLSKFLQLSVTEVQEALTELQSARRETGVVLLEANGFWQMATQSGNVDVVKNFLNNDLREKLTEATLEVLAIIAYRQPISKAEIEAIRGVNSQYSVRHLLMRGLIEKVPNPHDARGSLYQVTTEFLQHLGIQSMQDLPEFEKLVAHIKLPETPAGQVEAVNPEDPTESETTTNTTPRESTEADTIATEEDDDLEDDEELDEDDEDEKD